VVLVRLSALGDIVHTWPLAEALRAARPDMHLTWVVEEPFRPMVEGHPAVDEVVSVATKRWRRELLRRQTRVEVTRLRRRFSELQPELTIDSQGVAKSAMIARLSGAPLRIGLARPWRREQLAGLAYTSTLQGSSSHRHVVATNLELVRATGGHPPPEIQVPNGRWLLERLSDQEPPAPVEGPCVVLIPGAGWASKELPVGTLAGVARGLAAPTLDVVVAWGPGERSRAEAVVARAGSSARLAPSTDLCELVLLLSQARLVIGGDTGPVHLAASLGVPTLAVFTATDWQRNGPLGPRAEVISAADTRCGGPSAIPHATPIRTITAVEVVDRAGELLADTTG
jgi:heptosyltransferase-1